MDTTLLLLLAPLILLEIAMKLVALVSLRRHPRPRGPRLMWALLILLTTAVGWIAWFAVGRDPEA